MVQGESQAEDGTPLNRLKLVREFEALAVLWCCGFPSVPNQPNSVGLVFLTPEGKIKKEVSM